MSAGDVDEGEHQGGDRGRSYIFDPPPGCRCRGADSQIERAMLLTCTELGLS